ncbi:MAG: hypothetical protein WBA74_05360 [Cyclobacteriaceae bacterium]
MAVSYIPFLKVTATHDYYESGVAEGLAFVPDAATMRTLKNHRLKFQNKSGGFELSFQSANGIDPIIDFEESNFRFLIKLENALEFLNFTDLSVLSGYTPRKKVYFKNSPQETTQISAGLIDLIKPPQFSYQLPLETNDPANETAVLELSHESGSASITIDDIKSRSNGTFETPVDLAGKRSGLYTLQSSLSISADEGQENVLVDHKTYLDQIFGIIDIHYTSDTLSEYELVFQRKANLWNYIVINKSRRTLSEFNGLLVKDNNLSNIIPYQAYLFDKVESGLTVSGYDAVKFQSKTTIPFFEKPKSFIQLVREVNGSDLVLMKHLANPPVNQISSDNDESDIYVFV